MNDSIKYTVDMVIEFFANNESETATVEEWTGLSAQELASMSEIEIHAALSDALESWISNTIDHGWIIKECSDYEEQEESNEIRNS